MAPHYVVILVGGDPNGTTCYGACPMPFPPSSAPSPSPSPFPFPFPPHSPAPYVFAPSPYVFGPSSSPSPSPDTFSLPVLPIPPAYTETKHQLIRTLLLVVASLLATCALVLTYYAVLRRYRSLRQRRAAAAAATQVPPDSDDELREDLLATGGADQQPYHVWQIRTEGLDERTIGAISAVAYRKREGLVEGTDCAVCLGEFRDGEMLRLLPKCNHAFHIPCIDTWLRSHLNCPLCRAPILSPAPPAPAPAEAAAAILTSSSSTSPSSSSAAAPVGDQAGTSPEEPEIWMRIDLGGGGSEDGGGRAGSGAPPPPEDGGNGRATLQRVGRSVSMDPSALGCLLQRMGLLGASGEEAGKLNSEEHSSAAPKEWRRRWSNRRAASLMESGTPEMERSMSSGGGRLFPSMFSGRTRGAILPL